VRLGRTAAERLLERLQGPPQDRDPAPVIEELLPVDLVIRASTAPTS